MTAIQWTDKTDNIIVAVDENGERHGWWCRKISPGCKLCYAEKLNDSEYFGGNHLKYGGEAPVLKLREDIIDSWARQTKSKKHFVASMTDIFGEWVPQSWIFRYLDGMLAAPRQTFQMLTKRAANARVQICAWLAARGLEKLPAHMWIGVSVEDKERADERIPEVLRIPATVRFLSIEPLIGPVEFSDVTKRSDAVSQLGKKAIDGIHWVIVGGESGPGARPCNVEWIRSIVRQCAAAGVPVFVKQLGARPYLEEEDRLLQRVGQKDRKGGDWSEWPDDLRVRQFPEVTA